jgi:hypothetical protein
MSEPKLKPPADCVSLMDRLRWYWANEPSHREFRALYDLGGWMLKLDEREKIDRALGRTRGEQIELIK